jgi:hypothetical protein
MSAEQVAQLKNLQQLQLVSYGYFCGELNDTNINKENYALYSRYKPG